MNNIFIYGAGGLGKEIYDNLLFNQQLKKDMADINIAFVVDSRYLGDKTDFYGAKLYSYEYILEQYKNKDCSFVIANGEPDIRAKLYEKVKNDGFLLQTIIHPNAIISSTAKICDGVVICSGCFISSDTQIEDNVYCQPYSLLGHDSFIGKHTILSTLCNIAGKCNIGHSTYIAMGVPIMEGITVGNETIIGLGSVIKNNIGDCVIAIGDPCIAKAPNRLKRVFTKVNKE